MGNALLSSVHPESFFSLTELLKSGQLFHWEPMVWQGHEGYAGCLGTTGVTWIGQPDQKTVLIHSSDLAEAVRYFGLDHSIEAIQSAFPQRDSVLSEAIRFSPGLRIARQPTWECLATFITSSLKQVAHIRAISLLLRQRWGERHEWQGRVFYAYPLPEVLAAAGEPALRECGMGYRAKSLHQAALAVAEGRIDLASLQDATDLSRAQATLLELHGVGEKIANCTLLFGCGCWGAFPIDVWIERILRQLYRKRLKGARLQQWAVDHFGEHAGYAQQYLFHFARKNL